MNQAWAPIVSCRLAVPLLPHMPGRRAPGCKPASSACSSRRPQRRQQITAPKQGCRGGSQECRLVLLVVWARIGLPALASVRARAADVGGVGSCGVGGGGACGDGGTPRDPVGALAVLWGPYGSVLGASIFGSSQNASGWVCRAFLHCLCTTRCVVTPPQWTADTLQPEKAVTAWRDSSPERV